VGDQGFLDAPRVPIARGAFVAGAAAATLAAALLVLASASVADAEIHRAETHRAETHRAETHQEMEPNPSRGPTGSGATVVTGRVATSDGQPIDDTVIDLFNAESHSSDAAGYLGSTHTDIDGSYVVTLPAAGCYRLVFVTPARRQPGAGRRPTRELCTPKEVGGSIEIDTVVGSIGTGRVIGRVAYESGASGRAVIVESFLASGDGSRGTLAHSVATRADGTFRVDLAPGCYVVVVIAPGAELVVGSGRHGSRDVCVEPEATSDPVRVTLEGDAPTPTTMAAIELEILRLTNELRTNPDGPLRRRKALPSCVDEPFYRIVTDPATNQPVPVLPLQLDETASNGLARSWAIEMARTTRFRHRPSVVQQQIYAGLDIPVAAWGENIAWSAGNPISDVARIHFEGWRESETGHYCTLMTERFTHVGIGEYHVGDESWAVQNFYAPPSFE
jgi:hypothetical protein